MRQSKNVIRKIKIGKFESKQNKPRRNPENKSWKLQIGKHSWKIQNGIYTSKIHIGKYNSDDINREVQAERYHLGTTNRKIRIGEIPIGKYNSGNTVRKHKSENTKPKNKRP